MSFLGQLKLKFFNRKNIGSAESSAFLNEQEKQILEMISMGKSYQTIGDELGLTKEQVQKTIRIIYEKLQQKKINTLKS